MAEESNIDLDEVEDRLDIMEQVISELGRPAISKADRQILMTQYKHLEEVILQAFLDFFSNRVIEELKIRLPQLIVRFNTCSADFQDTWEQEMWVAYEFAHQGFEMKAAKDKPVLQTAQEIENLQELALTLSKLNRPTPKHMHRTSYVPKPQTLAEVDRDAQQFRQCRKQQQQPDPEEPTSRCRKCTLM